MSDGVEQATHGARRSRAFLFAGLGVVAIVALLALAGMTALEHYHIGQVESVQGGIAVVTVEELDETFTAEVVEPGLEPGTDVVLYVADDVVSIVSTSPRGVALVAALKDLL